MSFLIAHRAGNDLAALREAEDRGIELVEADVRLWHGRPEVRHLKTLGPIPIFWDRWELASPFAPRLTLGSLLDAAGPSTELLLDLKGADVRLAQRVLAELDGRRPVSVCARNWRLLEPFRSRSDVRRVYSAGTPRELRRLLRRFRGVELDGVSVHERLLDAATVGRLRERTALVMSWPVNTLQRARELGALGVEGLISDELELAGALAS
jgi:glycerophosphoryl diester phosphodiesterase